MSNRRRMFIGIAGFLAFVIGSFFFIWSQKARKEEQPRAGKAISGSGSQVSGEDPQRQVNYWIRLGDKMMDDGDYGSARSYYESALKLAPSNTAARAGVESANRAMGQDSLKNDEN